MDRKQFLVGTSVSLVSLIGLVGCNSSEEELQDDLAKEIVTAIPNIEDFTKNFNSSSINITKIEQYSLWHSNISKAIDGKNISADYDLDFNTIVFILKKTAEKTADYYSSLFIKIEDYNSRYTTWDLPELERNQILMRLVENEFAHAYQKLYSTRKLYTLLNQDTKDDLIGWLGKVYLDARTIRKEVSPFSVGKLVLRNIGVYYS